MRVLSVVLALIWASFASAQTTALRSLDTDYAAASWKAVGRIDLGQGSFCTGTLIAPDLVLTAAHCLYRPGTNQLWPVNQIRFLAGLRDGGAEAVRVAADAAAHDGFDPAAPLTVENVAHDVGLIRLAERISTFDVPPFAVHGDRVETGPVSVVSYGRGRETAQTQQKECQMLHRLGDAMIFDCDVTFGSSGAPVFSHLNGRGQVMAVISGMIEVDGHKRSVGMALPQRVAELKSQMRMQAAPPTAQLRRITVGGGNRSGFGAKFVKP